MLMWVMCPTASVVHRARGFSLIELSVVLVLISLATALVVPNLSSAYNRIQSRGDMDRLYLRLSNLGYEAYAAGRPISIRDEAAARRLLELDDSWEVEVVQAVEITAVGVCLGGSLHFTRNDFTVTPRLKPPYCYLDDD